MSLIHQLYKILSYCVCLVTQSCLTLATPQTVACQTPLTMGFSRQKYWSGLPFPSPSFILSLVEVLRSLKIHKDLLEIKKKKERHSIGLSSDFCIGRFFSSRGPLNIVIFLFMLETVFLFTLYSFYLGLPCSSNGKESA